MPSYKYQTPKKKKTVQTQTALVLYQKEDYMQNIKKIEMICDDLGYQIIRLDEEANKAMKLNKASEATKSKRISSLPEDLKNKINIIEYLTIQKENYKTKIEELKEKHKSMSEIPPIRHHSNFNRYHYISNKSLDMIFDDAPSHIKQNSYSNSLTGNLSDFMSNHVELSHQLRQLDYDNNKVNSLLKISSGMSVM